jgi:hypothetical protein
VYIEDRHGWPFPAARERPRSFDAGGHAAVRTVADARVGENARVPAYTVNEDAVRHAKRLIDARRYVLRSRWQQVQPRLLHRMGLIACHYRAAEWRHKEIELAAHELLQYLDRKSAS